MAFSVCQNSIRITNQSLFKMPGVPDIGSLWRRTFATLLEPIGDEIIVIGAGTLLGTGEPMVQFERTLTRGERFYTLSEFFRAFESISVSKARAMNSLV